MHSYTCARIYMCTHIHVHALARTNAHKQDECRSARALRALTHPSLNPSPHSTPNPLDPPTRASTAHALLQAPFLKSPRYMPFCSKFYQNLPGR